MEVMNLLLDDEDIRERLVAIFANQTSPVSGAELSEQLGLSRTAIWKHIKALERVGFTFEASTRVGYRLTTTPDELMSALVKPHLSLMDDRDLGGHILWEPERISTNATAITLASQGLPHGSVVTCGVQTGGKGRRDKLWTSPQGGMWFSILLRSPCALSQAADLTLLASIAVRRAIEKHGANAKIKWPNDILIDGRKVCGILAQMRSDGEMVDYAVIGIGINANFPESELPEALRERATTLLSTIGHPVERPKLLADILTELSTLYKALERQIGGFASVRDEWKKNSATLGSRVEIRVGTETIVGKALDVDDSGNLIVQMDDGQIRAVHSGEVLFQSRDMLT